MFRTMMAVGFAAGLLLSAPALGQERPGVDLSPFGPEAGDWELTLGGSASNDRKFRGGGFNVDASLGYFFTDEVALAVRQNVQFSDFDRDTSGDWIGSTHAAIQYHFQIMDLDRLRPFVGANAGGFYSDTERIKDSLSIGFELGAKWYAKPKTFLFAQGGYNWLIRSGVDDQVVYTLGIGFNF